MNRWPGILPGFWSITLSTVRSFAWWWNGIFAGLTASVISLFNWLQSMPYHATFLAVLCLTVRAAQTGVAFDVLFVLLGRGHPRKIIDEKRETIACWIAGWSKLFKSCDGLLALPHAWRSTVCFSNRLPLSRFGLYLPSELKFPYHTVCVKRIFPNCNSFGSSTIDISPYFFRNHFPLKVFSASMTPLEQIDGGLPNGWFWKRFPQDTIKVLVGGVLHILALSWFHDRHGRFQHGNLGRRKRSIWEAVSERFWRYHGFTIDMEGSNMEIWEEGSVPFGRRFLKDFGVIMVSR